MARFPWRRPGGAADDATKAAPQATMVPLGDVIAALTSQQQNTSTAPTADPLPRPQQWATAPFGPGTPLNPQPLDQARPDTRRAEPRLWQYPVSWNLPGAQHKLVPWKTLRDAGDTPLFRQCIGVRKGEITDLGWDIALSQDAVEQAQADGTARADAEQHLREKLAPEIARLVQFWRTPDRGNGHEFGSWVGMLLEEQLVLDAVAVYPRYTYGGDLFSVEVLDGSTIKPLLDERGGRPMPPYVAYQQILYGFPRGEYTADTDETGDVPGFPADQLIYERREVRTWTPYGYSPVEQALIDGDLYLKRLAWMRGEYDDASMPTGWMLNDGTNQWSPEELLEYERSFNDHHAGNTAARHRWPFLPPGLAPQDMPGIPEQYKPDYDLHLIKLVAGHFDVTLPELGFSEAKGLGSSGWSEGQEAVQFRKSTLPTARWIEAMLTRISRIHLGMPPELEFKFLGLDEQDEADADAIAAERVKSGRMTFNEDRDRLGLPRYAFEEADKPAIVTATGVSFIEGAAAAAEAGRNALAAAAAGGNKETSPGGEGGDRVGEGGEPAEDALRDAAKAELAAFRRWARKNAAPKRPFEFTAPRAVLVKMAADLAEDDRVVFKAGDVGPKDRWPGWALDEQLVDHYAPLIRKALTGAVDTRAVAEGWLKADKAPDVTKARGPRGWLGAFAGLGKSIRQALTVPMLGMWTEGWMVGDRSASAVLNDENPDWGGWKPGNPAAARKLLGGGQALQKMLDHYGIDTIKSVADSRMDELASKLAEAQRDGWSVDQLAKELATVLDSPERARMVAATEIARGQSQASMQLYRDAGVKRVEWWTAPTDACPVCTGNAEQGGIKLGARFDGGVDSPPQHPHCRCTIAPASSLN